MTTRERHMRKNNPAPKRGRGGRGSRERQSVWCCGVSYQRWRFIGKQFPGTHHTHCVHCGKLLVWPEIEARLVNSPRAQDRKNAQRRASRDYHRRRTSEFYKLGLTCKGQPRQRRPHVSDLERAWLQFRNSAEI